MHGNSPRENRETPSVPVAEAAAGRLEKAMSQESNMHAGGESDGCVIPSKCLNKGGQPLAEGMEGMEGKQPTKENIGQATPPRTQSRIGELSDLLGVRKAARKDKQMRFTALLHHVTVDLLRDSYYALKREAAPGVDGVTWKEYEQPWMRSWQIFTAESIEERIERSLPREPIFRKPMDDNDHWASQPWKIRSCSRP
jgi:RNA-directed DNA polymerase